MFGIIHRFTLCAWLACSSGLAAAEPVPDALQFLPPGTIVMGDHWGERLNACLEHRVLAQEVTPLVQPFKDHKDRHEWRSEFWGKWITSAEWAARWNADPRIKEHVAQAIKELGAVQGPDGYLGAYAPENHLQSWDVWGRKYTMLGFLGWHDLTGDATSLEHARRVADHLLTEVGPAHPNVDMFKNDMWQGMASSSVIEPIILLYRRTGDARYLEFAQWIVHEWERPGGPDIMRKALRGEAVFRMFPGPQPVIKDYMDIGRSKAYEMMSCFEGLLELYRVTHQTEYRDAAMRVFENIRDTEITIIGSGSDWERWCDGTRRQTERWEKGMETCVTVTWVKFAAQLLRLTGESKYGDLIETSAWNALLGALGPDGKWFCHHAPLAGEKEPAPEQCGMHQNCCVANGPRGLMLLPMLAVMQDAQGPVVNLYGAMRATAPLASGNQVEIEQQTAYPVANTVRILVNPSRTEAFQLKLRIPAWSSETKVTMNGRRQKGVRAGSWLALQRTWNPGDVVTLTFDMTARLVPAPGHPDYVAVQRGPLVLARDARLEGANVDQPIRIKTDDQGRVDLKWMPGSKPANVWTAWQAPLIDGSSISLCDFSSAGNTWNTNSHYRVWMPVK